MEHAGKKVEGERFDPSKPRSDYDRFSKLPWEP